MDPAAPAPPRPQSGRLPTESARGARRDRTIYLVGFYVSAVLLGTQAALAVGGGESMRLVRILLGLVIAHVVVADARTLGKPFPHLAIWQLCLFWTIAIPGCVIALRRGRGVLYLLGHFLLFLLVIAGTTFLVDGLFA